MDKLEAKGVRLKFEHKFTIQKLEATIKLLYGIQIFFFNKLTGFTTRILPNILRIFTLKTGIITNICIRSCIVYPQYTVH